MAELKRKRKGKRGAVNVKLLPLKLLIFVLYGGMAALYPYLTIHMKSLGLTITETAIVYALLPLLCFMGPTIAGAAADRLGNYKIILVGAILLNVALHTLLFFAVPEYLRKEIPETHNLSSVTINFPCQLFTETTVFDDKFLTFANLTEDLYCSITNAMFSNDPLKVLPSSCTTNCAINTKLKDFNICINGKYLEECLPINEILSSWAARPLSGNKAGLWNSSLNDHEFQSAVCWDYLITPQNCAATCSLETIVSASCTRIMYEGDRQMTFWLYFVFRVLASIALAAVMPITDAAMIQMTIDYHGNIGMQRMYSLLGVCVMAPVAGILIDQLGMGYAPAFYIYDGMHILAAVIVFIMSLNVKLPAEHIFRNVGKLMKSAKVVVFIFVVFFIGAAWGLLDSFLFWFMEEDLHSPKWLLGFTNTVGAVAGMPVMAGATKIIRKVGHTNVLIFSMFVYGARYIGYSYIYNAYYVLPLEALEAFTNSLMWITATIYAAKIAPDYLATLQGIVGGMHYGIGRGAGALVGGLMIRAVGTRQAWRIFGMVCFGCGTLYALLQYFWLRKLQIPGKAAMKKSKDTINGNCSPVAEEIKIMGEEDEEKLYEIAMMNVMRATTAASTSDSMINLRTKELLMQQHGYNVGDSDEEEELGYSDDDQQRDYSPHITPMSDAVLSRSN